MSHDDQGDKSKAQSPKRSYFAVPPALKRVFDKFPLTTYTSNELPVSLHRPADKHVLYVFTTAESADKNAPSFNPSCLKWQTYMRIRGVEYVTAPSNNHASPSGSLPFVIPAQGDAAVSIKALRKWIVKEASHDSVVAESKDVRYEAYSSLLDGRIRLAWLYQLYLLSPNSSLMHRLYVRPCSSNTVVQLALQYQLRQAADLEIRKSTSRTILDAELLREADEAFSALSTLLGDKRWFFEDEISLFDAGVFAYTHLLLDDALQWKENPDESIQPSGSPQPPGRACIRCQQQGLECIIDKTILGRPSSKRKPAQEDATQNGRTKSISNENPLDIIEDDDLHDDTDIAGFVLAEVEDEIDQVASRLPRRDRPEDHEKYQALIDPYHLMSTVIVRDRRYGATCSSSLATSLPDPIRFMRGPLIDVIDARLAWVRLYFPYIPTISSLMRENIAPSMEAGTPAVSTKALVLILMLIAVDARASEPPPKELDRQAITASLAKCGLELLFIPPTHRHTIYALELIMEYWPTALVAGQNAAAACLKGELYVILMKRVSDKLKLEAAPKILRAKLTNPTAATEEIAPLVLDVLLWCRICYLDTSIGALVTKLPIELAEAKMQLEEGISAVWMALSRYIHLPPSAKFLYMRMLVRASEMQAYSDIKSHRSDLQFLATIMTAHARSAAEHKRTCSILLERHASLPEAQAIKDLVSFDSDYMHQNVSQHGIAYTVFSGFVPFDVDPTIADVLQISDQVIAHIKTGQSLDSPQSYSSEDVLSLGIPGFLARFAPPRPGEMCQLLKHFINGSQRLSLNGIAWQPPSREISASILYQCKLLVEENAARMKGFAWLCEDVDTQLLLFEDCAREFTNMDIRTLDGRPSSVEEGSVIGAAAKLIRSLATIVGVWKNRFLEQQRRLIAAGEIPQGIFDVVSRVPTSPSVVDTDTFKAAERAAMREKFLGSADTAEPYPAVDDIWTATHPYDWAEVNLDDWSAWPQANPVDFWNMGLPDEATHHDGIAHHGFG
ncbi:hypothetical protein AMS68_002007 [Peltaster fructicola]|uniref:Thioredoxin-like fold domain-containing protein n=1 Tax=Peltaster fructicola TaxID=286661 RepID=A0A6H0XPT4_9PEZI|nr:hypothetical protein AMS68_002007 [Peltaster fructicola]